MSQAELGRKLRVRPETLGKVIDRLGLNGLLVQSGSAANERDVRLVITPEGRKVLERAYELEEEQERTLGSDEQLRAELINRIRALGLDSDAGRARPSLKLVPKGDPEGGDASPSSATG